MLGKNTKKDKITPTDCKFCGKELTSIYAVQCSDCFYRNNTKENHWKWKKDRTTLVQNEKKHLCQRYMAWRKEVKDRDGWKCRMNNEDCKGRLEAHHILRWSTHPELRYEVNNGITLCAFHHPRKINDEQKLAPVFMELVTEEII
jgi:ribosomal protein L37E